MSKIRYERATELLEADVGDELMALDVEGGTCFGFNSVATGVWRHLASPKTFKELSQALVAEYEVDSERCAADLRELLHDLRDKGLVREVVG